MHHKLIILTDRYRWENDNDKNGKAINVQNVSRFKNSLAVRNFVSNWLEKEGFTSQGRFGGGRADWFVIGGRWVHDLILICLNPLLWKSYKDKMNEIINENLAYPEIEKKIFKEFFPKYKGPNLFKDSKFNTYNQLGTKDSAMIVNKKLWIRLIKPLINESDEDPWNDPIIYIEDNELKNLTEKETIDKMWCVIVDYHD